MCARSSPLLGGGTRVGAASGVATAAGLPRLEVVFTAAAGVGSERASRDLVGVEATGARSTSAERRLARTGAMAVAAGFVAVAFVGRATGLS